DPIPKIIDVIIVKINVNINCICTFVEIDAAILTKLLPIFNPKPVFVTTPTIIPAHAVAAATPSAVLAPDVKASIKREKLIRVSFNGKLTIIADKIPNKAVLSILNPLNNKIIITIIGNNKWIFLSTTDAFGICSLGKPCKPSFFASKCVIIQIPAKYNVAGISAALAIFQ